MLKCQVKIKTETKISSNHQIHQSLKTMTKKWAFYLESRRFWPRVAPIGEQIEVNQEASEIPGFDLGQGKHKNWRSRLFILPKFLTRKGKTTLVHWTVAAARCTKLSLLSRSCIRSHGFAHWSLFTKSNLIVIFIYFIKSPIIFNSVLCTIFSWPNLMVIHFLLTSAEWSSNWVNSAG